MDGQWQARHRAGRHERRATEFRRQSEVPGPVSLRELQEGQGFDTQWLHLWASSPERAWYLNGKRVSRVRVALGILITAGAWLLVPQAFALSAPAWNTAGLAVVGALVIAWAAFPYWAARRAFSQRRKLHVAYRVNTAVEEIYQHARQGKELSLPMLFNLNRRQLDEYQVLTKQQQRAAFRLTWLAAFMGFAVLLVSITMLASSAVTGADKYILSAVTGLGAALSGYLGQTFFRAHREAMDQLNYYYGEPSLTGRLLAAERITGNLKAKGDTQAEYVKRMVEALLDWENPVFHGHKKHAHHGRGKNGADQHAKATSNGGPAAS